MTDNGETPTTEEEQQATRVARLLARRRERSVVDIADGLLSVFPDMDEDRTMEIATTVVADIGDPLVLADECAEALRELLNAIQSDQRITTDLEARAEWALLTFKRVRGDF